MLTTVVCLITQAAKGAAPVTTHHTGSTSLPLPRLQVEEQPGPYTPLTTLRRRNAVEAVTVPQVHYLLPAVPALLRRSVPNFDQPPDLADLHHHSANVPSRFAEVSQLLREQNRPND